MQAPILQNWKNEITHYEQIALSALEQAKALGATQAEVSCHKGKGFSILVRMQEVETLEYHRDKAFSLTVYFGQKKGQASTTDFNPEAIQNVVASACRIAQLTQPDEYAGLAEPRLLAKTYPELNLYHPWPITPAEAIEQAKICEEQAKAIDKRIFNSEGVGIDTGENLMLYANSYGFMGNYLSSLYSIDCTLVAKDETGNMQRDGSYTVSRDPNKLQLLSELAKESGEKTIRRLGARRLKTCRAPVIFQAEVAKTLISYFLKAISGRALYRDASFLLNKLNQPIFPSYITIQDCPHVLKGLGSAPFDAEGVKNTDRFLVNEGVLQSYLLSSYSARRLGLQTTGHAGGAYNVYINTQLPNLESLLKQMGKGLLVTEVIGHGVNLVTGDYSQGAAGFWVENGEIQYPVEEITIAGNLSEMYQNIAAVAGDIDQRSKIQTGSILIEQMTIAGE